MVLLRFSHIGVDTLGGNPQKLEVFSSIFLVFLCTQWKQHRSIFGIVFAKIVTVPLVCFASLRQHKEIYGHPVQKCRDSTRENQKPQPLDQLRKIMGV